MDTAEVDLGELAQQLDTREKRWSLYRIQDTRGDEVPFNLNEVQQELEDNLWWLNLILKSRQHGVTTWACLRALDQALWQPGSRCGIIAHTKADAQKFFVNKVLYAYDRLPELIRYMIPTTRRDMNGTLELANGSTIEVSVSHRGGTFSFLHISEYGPMCALSPQRAAEVRSGALNTVHEGAIVTIESTAYGREGDFHLRCRKAQALRDRVWSGTATLTRMDYRFYFFGWFRDPKNTMDPTGVEISPEMHQYFDEIGQVNGITLRPEQRAWYTKKAEEQGDRMKQEHPSTPDEAFAVGQEGSYYIHELNRARREGRVTRVPIERDMPVNTFWDIGRNDLNSVWFHQQSGLEHRLIDYFEDAGHSIDYYAEHLIKWREEHHIAYGVHYLPHDADVVELTRRDGRTRREVLEDLGIRPVVVVPRIEQLGDGIDMMRRMFALLWFDASRCETGLLRLEQYRRQWNQQVQAHQDHPVRNDARNAADALRQLAQEYLPSSSAVQPRAGRQRKRNWKTV